MITTVQACQNDKNEELKKKRIKKKKNGKWFIYTLKGQKT